MEATPKQYKILVTFPDGIVDTLLLDNMPEQGSNLEIKSGCYRVTEAHLSMVQPGHISEYPDIYWDWVISLN